MILRTHRLIWATSSLLWLLLLVSPSVTQAQFIRFHLVVEDEVGLERSRNLETGNIPVGYGWVRVGLHDELTGRITLTTTENINLLVTFEAPPYLIQDSNNRLDLELEAAYLNNGTRAPLFARSFDGNRALFPVNNSGMLADRMRNAHTQLSVDILFYGSVYVGMVEPGLYQATIPVVIEYL